jgi:hypothetical protein
VHGATRAPVGRMRIPELPPKSTRSLPLVETTTPRVRVRSGLRAGGKVIRDGAITDGEYADWGVSAKT